MDPWLVMEYHLEVRPVKLREGKPHYTFEGGGSSAYGRDVEMKMRLVRYEDLANSKMELVSYIFASLVGAEIPSIGK